MSTDSDPYADPDDLSLDEIEQAYLRALQVAEAAEVFFPTEEQAAAVYGAAEDDPLPTSKPQPQETAPAIESIEGPRIASWQVLEALLFVGGQPLTGRQLADLLGGSHTHEQVDDLLANLNQQYFEEGRPYEIRLTEGGYRMLLRPEFEAVRSRVFGQGPKEVKLSQEALEMLAFVAYRQPVTAEDIEETGKAGAMGLIRQLLRRELIELKRDDESDSYRTTKRFLELFGLTSIEDLPQLRDFNFK